MCHIISKKKIPYENAINPSNLYIYRWIWWFTMVERKKSNVAYGLFNQHNQAYHQKNDNVKKWKKCKEKKFWIGTKSTSLVALLRCLSPIQYFAPKLKFFWISKRTKEKDRLATWKFLTQRNLKKTNFTWYRRFLLIILGSEFSAINLNKFH